MKNRLTNAGKIMLGIALALMVSGLQAQPGQGRYMHHDNRPDSGWHARNPLNLSEDQQKEITSLRTRHQQEMVQYRNDMYVKRAELWKNRSSENPDLELINQTIEEIGKLFTLLQKKQIAHELDVRNLLTPEQRLIFDARQSHRFCGERMEGRGFEGPGGAYGMHPGGRGHRM